MHNIADSNRRVRASSNILGTMFKEDATRGTLKAMSANIWILTCMVFAF
jgi:hypothetical protein